MARTVNFKGGAEDRLTLQLPWGDYVVKRATRSVLKAVHGMQEKAAELGESPEPDAGAAQIAELLEQALEGDGFRAGFDAAWAADEITQHEVVAIAGAVMDELGGGAAAGEG